MEIVDNFLDPEEFKKLQHVVLGQEFDWYYNKGICYEDDGLSQFTHTILDGFKDRKSNTFPYFKPIFNKLGGEFFRVKANLTSRTEQHVNTGFHTDFTSDEFLGKTAVFYMNTNNGYTEFMAGAVVNSIANRMLIFDSESVHAGVTSTDNNQRVTININFKK